MMLTQFERNDIEALQGQALLALWGTITTDGLNGRPLRFENIRFEFESGAFELSVNNDTDEIVVNFSVVPGDDNLIRLDETEILSCLIGRRMGWVWVATNDRGYSDTILLSFDGPVPQFAFVGLASDVAVYELLGVVRQPASQQQD